MIHVGFRVKSQPVAAGGSLPDRDFLEDAMDRRKRIFYMVLTFILNVLTDCDDMAALMARIGGWLGRLF